MAVTQTTNQRQAHPAGCPVGGQTGANPGASKKKQHPRSKILCVGLLLFVLLVSVAVGKGLRQTAEIRREEAQVRAEVDRVNAENQALEVILQTQDPQVFASYIKQAAREQLGLVLPGEWVYVDRSIVE
ncbi:MAG: septum formation initiator family protein [Oscillospiraceae bacterium]|jgi:cell division protein FtsB|nr:septum formation initiator family protein [Oscillospiraceae bacterium]